MMVVALVAVVLVGCGASVDAGGGERNPGSVQGAGAAGGGEPGSPETGGGGAGGEGGGACVPLPPADDPCGVSCNGIAYGGDCACAFDCPIPAGPCVARRCDVEVVDGVRVGACGWQDDQACIEAGG